MSKLSFTNVTKRISSQCSLFNTPSKPLVKWCLRISDRNFE